MDIFNNIAIQSDFHMYLSDHSFEDDVIAETESGKRKCKRRRIRKHVPHSLQPATQVTKRNERERGRVNALNDNFRLLRSMLPYGPRTKRVSKENILKYTILYINELSNLIREHDEQILKNLHDISEGSLYDVHNTSWASSSASWRRSSSETEGSCNAVCYGQETYEAHQTYDTFMNAGCGPFVESADIKHGMESGQLNHHPHTYSWSN